MIKTVTIPQKNSFNLSIPNNYIGKKIEILIYAVDELTEQSTLPTNTKLSDKYRGIITKEQGLELNEHIKQMRSEWNSI
jgi:hypothetical protein